MNKYIYFSSENQNNHADFQINFQNPIKISPQSRIRCTNIRVNPNNNLIEVRADQNDRFVFSIGYPWTDNVATVNPFYLAVIPPGVYDLEGGSTASLTTAVQKAFNDAVVNNPLLRGGFEVTESSKILTVVFSYMNKNDYYYTIPTLELPEELLDVYEYNSRLLSNVSPGDNIETVHFNIGSEAQDHTDDTGEDQWGIELLNRNMEQMPANEQIALFTSPPVNLLGSCDPTADTITEIANLYINLSDIDVEEAVTEGHDWKIQFVGYGEKDRCFLKKNIDRNDIWYKNEELSPIAPYRTDNGLFNFTLTPDPTDDSKIIVDMYIARINRGNNRGWTTVVQASVLNGSDLMLSVLYNGNLTPESTKLELRVYEKPAGDDDYVLKATTGMKTFYSECLKSYNYLKPGVSPIADPSVFNKPCNIRLGIATTLKGKNVPDEEASNFYNENNMVLSMNYNPIDKPNGFFNGAFQAANALEKSDTDVTIPFVIFGDGAPSESIQDIIGTIGPNPQEFIDTAELTLQTLKPNAGIIFGLDETGVQYNVGSSYNTGIVFEGNTNANYRDFPMMYLSILGLSIENYTGDALFGQRNSFLMPIDFNSGAGTNNLHTTVNDYGMYSTMTNTYPLSITSLRVRITDINGIVTKGISAYTIGCIEISEDPMRMQEKILNKILSQKSSLGVPNQIQPIGPQSQ